MNHQAGLVTREVLANGSEVYQVELLTRQSDDASVREVPGRIAHQVAAD
jgi:uncharacterized membrane protein YhiD involved in acid resistance